VFFFAKKNQKTLVREGLLLVQLRIQPNKSFCFFFQKEALSC
jgi:hypothetical protein